MAKKVIFSELHGRVFSAGQPANGAVVERVWNWGLTGKSERDQTVTDTEGHFSLPAVLRSGGLFGWLPHEPFVQQTIKVNFLGETRDVWMLDKRNYRAGGEFGPGNSSAAIAVTVNLDAPIAHNGPVYGRSKISPMAQTPNTKPGK